LKEKERRKSLGTMLDSSSDGQPVLTNGDEFWCASGSNSPSIGTVASNRSLSRSTATGHPELDLCLNHHLKRCCNAFKTLSTLYGPLQYRENEMLTRLEHEAVNLDDILRLANSLPSLPNVANGRCPNNNRE
uniref:Mid1-interacting protein 1 n=2 Tax=Anisakis simplex TaxID=6269 RepID=A0A0M3JFE9_ANISI